MKTILILTSITLAGCAAPPPRSPAYQQCAYQAKLATASSSAGAVGDWMKEEELTQMCLNAKGAS